MTGKVKAGVSTFSLGGVSVTAYVLAVLAFLDGQHDTTTIGLVATGTVALVTMAAGRFWQAVEKIRQPAAPVMLRSNTTPLEHAALSNLTGTGARWQGSTATTPRPSAGVTLADEPREGDTTGCQPQDDH